MTTSELKDFASKLGSLQTQRQSLSIRIYIVIIDEKLYESILKAANDPITSRQWKTEECISLLIKALFLDAMTKIFSIMSMT